MLFMIIERFKNGDARPVYERYRERGRLAPDGLRYVSSWVDAKLARCYQVMETDEPALIQRWIANWSDLTDFEIIPVLTSQEAADAALGAKSPEVPPVEFGVVTPVFGVRNLDDSVNYYVNVLGFAIDFRDGNTFASVSRGHAAIFLAEADQGPPGTWAWVGVSDIEPLFDEYRRKGAKIRQPPTNFSWAYEMQIQDPDGHVLRFGSEPKQGLSFGPWLDMNGDRWLRAPDGRWLVERHPKS